MIKMEFPKYQLISTSFRNARITNQCLEMTLLVEHPVQKKISITKMNQAMFFTMSQYLKREMIKSKRKEAEIKY